MLVRSNLNLTFAKAGEVIETEATPRVQRLIEIGRLTRVGSDGQPETPRPLNDLTVAELREALDTRGIEAPAGARKDDLVALLDGEEPGDEIEDEPEEG